MSMWHFTECCFIIPLEAGCLIIGYLHLIGTILAALISIIFLSSGILLSDSENYQDLSQTLIVTFIYVLIFLMFCLCFSIILLIGLHKKRPNLIQAFLIFRIIFLFIEAGIFYLALYSKLSLPQIIGRIIHFLFAIYFVLVLKSYHRNLKEEKKEVPESKDNFTYNA